MEKRDHHHSTEVNKDEAHTKSFSYKLKAGLFLASAAGIGLFSGFGGALASVKKKDPKSFAEGIVVKQESGVAFAARALAYGSLLSVCGTGLFFWGIWKLSGAKDFQDFRLKVGQVLPRVTKTTPQQGRTEFEGLTDLLTYIIEESERQDKEKKALKDVEKGIKKEI